MPVWLIGLSFIIGRVALLNNFVEGWDLSKDPVDIWIALGVAALLMERGLEYGLKEKRHDVAGSDS